MINSLLWDHVRQRDLQLINCVVDSLHHKRSVRHTGYAPTLEHIGFGLAHEEHIQFQ